MAATRRDVFKAFSVAIGATLVGHSGQAQEPPGTVAPVSPTPQSGENQATNAQAPAQPLGQGQRSYTFLNAEEAGFVEAAIARLIPSEPEWAGALEADVSIYIDRQLGGGFGQGSKFYRMGPFSSGAASQGYQLQHTPAELFRLGARLLDENLRKSGVSFKERKAEEQDAILAALEKGDGLESKPIALAFFQLLHGLTMEGYFGDPVYGGNKDMVSWRMIGFPGAQAGWANVVEDHGIALCVTPQSIANAHHDHSSQKRG